MTDAEIIKALECCYADELKNYTCDECPYKTCGCSYALCKDALDLINRQQAENNTLKYQVNRLKKYDERRDIALHSRLIAEARAEAIKEFANGATSICYEEFESELEIAHTFAGIINKTLEIFEVKKMCEFCSKFDFTTATTEISGNFANIKLALCHTRFPKEQQFNFCPVCGKSLNNLVKEMVGEAK